MTTTDHHEFPLLAGPRPPEGQLSTWRYLKAFRDSTISIFPQEYYEKDIVVRQFGRRISFIVNDPAAIKHIMLDNAANYLKDDLTLRILRPALGYGLLTSDGAVWRQDRRIMAPHFDYRSVGRYVPTMIETAKNLVEEFGSMKEHIEIDMASVMMRTTLSIMSSALFSSDSDDLADVVKDGVSQYQTSVRPSVLDLLGLPDWFVQLFSSRRGGSILQRFDNEIDRLLDERSSMVDPPEDLLTQLIMARDAETGQSMSRQDIRDQVVTIFLAGHETTSLALIWAWYLLSLHPWAEEKLHRELETVIGRRQLNGDDVQNLRYTRMVLEESMRLYPPSHTFGRKAVADDEILGHRVPASSTVVISPWLLHRRRSIWNHPNRFDPERFTVEHRKDRHRFAYLPFGAGPRTCIGMTFAMNEAIIILASLAREFRFRLKPGQLVDPQGLVTLRPRDGLPMMMEHR